MSSALNNPEQHNLEYITAIPRIEHCVVSVKGVLSVFQDRFVFQNFISNGGDLRAILMIGMYLGKFNFESTVRARQLAQEDAKYSGDEHEPALSQGFPHTTGTCLLAY